MEAESQVIHVHLLDYSILYEAHKKDSRLARRFRKMTEEEETCPTDMTHPYNVPIVGYEIVEQRERFTVYKIRVEKLARSWFIFRRYSDFTRLNEKLICKFPSVKLKLPPKRCFGNNFNADFIAKRADGLQNFIKTILQHEKMRVCNAVREFFCLDDPPGPFDSLEESRAYVQYLEERLEDQRGVVEGLTSQLDAVKSQLEQARVQIKSLECTLRNERKERKVSTQPNHSTPALPNSLSCGQLDAQLSDISDGCSAPEPKPRKSVSFAMTKAASEGNLMQLRNKKLAFPTLKDQKKFHSITFGDDSFLYNGFLEVQLHSNVTDKMKERKRKHRKPRAKGEGRKEKQNDCSPDSSDLQSSDIVWSTRKDRKREKRDSGIIQDSFTTGTDSDF